MAARRSTPKLFCLCLCAAIGLGAGAAMAQTPWPSEEPPRPLPARDVKFPPYDVRTLPNGLQIVVVLHHEQPAVSMRLLIRTGGASDPKGKLGLAHLAASLLDQGTATKSATEMNDAIDFIGGAMGAGAGTDRATDEVDGVVQDRKSTPSELQSHLNLACRLLLQKKKHDSPATTHPRPQPIDTRS